MSNNLYEKFLSKEKLTIIAGPCAIEGKLMAEEICEVLLNLSEKHDFNLVFKGSFKKANRSRKDSFTGIGDLKALDILGSIREKYSVPTTTDIHEVNHAELVQNYVDIIQIPAFLARQTDLLTAAAKTGKIVNIKKGQFMSPESMTHARNKILEEGNNNVLLTERGSMFGYGDLVVDFRGFKTMREIGPVIYDVTHSLQQPNTSTGITGGRPELIEHMALCGVAAGVNGIFIETHSEPSIAKSDGKNMLKLDKMEDLCSKLTKLHRHLKG